MAGAVGLSWLLIAKDDASPAFLRVAAAADKAAASTARASKGMLGASARMSAAGARLTRSWTVPLLGIAAVSVKAATDFNASMTRIQTQAGGTAKDVKTLTAAVLGMKGAQQGPNDLAKALYHLKSVGLDNAGAMRALKVSSDLAAVGGANLEETTNALAGAWRTGIKGAKNFHTAAATVNAVIGAGNMTLEDFTAALGTGILPSAKTFGLTMKDVGSALALFTDEGVPANAAATRLRMSFSLLGAPSKAAEKQLANIGLTGLKLADDMRKPNGLITAIGDLKSHLEDPQYKLSLSEQAQLLSHAFGGGRSSSAILSLINNFDVLKQKQDQVTRSLGKYDAAVAAQKATPAAKFHQAVAELEKAGVLLGTQLLPIATQFAHVLTGLASGFNGLSTGQKHFIVEVGVAMAVLGPMLMLVGKVGKALALMWTVGVLGPGRFIAGTRGAMVSMSAMESGAYRAGSAFNKMGVLAKGASSAVAGFGAGAVIGSFTRGASQVKQGLGAIASIASGAAMGGAIGGPFGAAIGGVTGLLGDLASSMGGSSQAAAQRAAQLAQDTDQLTAALQRDGGAVRGTTKDWIANQLATTGALSLLQSVGLSYQTVTSAALGNKTAVAQVNAVYKGLGDAASISPIGKAAAAVLDLNAGLRAGKAAILDEDKAATAMYAAHHKVAAAVTRSSDAVSLMAAGSHAATGAMRDEGGAASSLGMSLRQLTKDFLKTANAALGIAENKAAFLDAIHSMDQAIKTSKGNLGLHAAASRAAREQLYQAAQGALALDNGTQKGNRALLAQIATLRQHAIQDGATAGAVHKILEQLGLLPNQIPINFHTNAAQVHQQLIDIQTQINKMHGTTLFVGVAGGHAPGANGSFTGGKASGGGLPNGVSAVGERGPELAIKRGPNVQILSNSQSRRFLAATGMRAPGFAGGTNPITTKQSGGKTVWVYKGQQYSTLRAAQNAEGYRLAGAPGVGGTTYTRKAADNALAKAIKSLDKVFNHMSRHDMPNLAKALGKTGSDVKSAVGAWLQDAKSLGVSTATRRSIAAQGRDIASNVNARNRAQARLQSLLANKAALKNSVGAAGRGGFDITNAGTNATNAGVSFGAFRAQELQYNKIVHKWASGIRKLSSLGFGKSPTGRAMLAQFAQADPTVALPRITALLSASPRQLAGIIATEKDIGKTSSALGGFLGGQKYGDKIGHQRAEIQLADRIISQAFDRLEKRLERIENRPIEVDVTLDGKKVASGVAKGAKRNGRRN